MVVIYARDLRKDLQTDEFMGEGFEKALKKAEDNNTDLIIGEYFDNSIWREV